MSEERESSENMSNSEIGDKEQNTDVVKASNSDGGFLLQTFLQKKQNKSIQDSSDIHNIRAEPKASTSSTVEIIRSPLCTKAAYFDAKTSKSNMFHCFESDSARGNSEENLRASENSEYNLSARENSEENLRASENSEYNLSARENSEENLSASENSPSENDSDDSSSIFCFTSDCRVNISRHGIYRALSEQYNYLCKCSNKLKTPVKNSSIFLQNSGCSAQIESDVLTDSACNSNSAPSSIDEERNLENAEDEVRELERTDYFLSQDSVWTDISHSQELLDNLSDDCTYSYLEQVAVVLINRVRETLQDMNKLLKDMDKGPFWMRMIRKNYNACGNEARRNRQCLISERITWNIFTNWPVIQFRVGILWYWLNKTVLFAQNVTLHDELIMAVFTVREMIIVILSNDGLRDITHIFDDIPAALRLNDDIKFVLDVKKQAASIIVKLMSIVSYIEHLILFYESECD